MFGGGVGGGDGWGGGWISEYFLFNLLLSVSFCAFISHFVTDRSEWIKVNIVCFLTDFVPLITTACDLANI